MKDKFIRLGTPFIIVMYILGPIDNLIRNIFIWGFPIKNFVYAASPGPLWFAGWLLIFNQAYVWTEHETAWKKEWMKST